MSNQKINANFKITFLEETKSSPVQNTLEELKNKITQLFQISADNFVGLEIVYKDEEDDLIVLSDAEDYNQLLSLTKEKNIPS